ncbi:AAA family ATPase [bacterium BFN5]|nr:AAA family ATPase [bacterium BFN5]QJW45517.1 AAA family ATPase [bacterium BFN5]
MEQENVARERLLRVFRFLQALDQHRNPVKRQVLEHSWTLSLKELPSHSAIDFKYPIDSEADTDVIFRVRRPAITKCPEPPYILTEWLESQWQDPFKKMVVKKTITRYQNDGTKTEELLADKPERKLAFEKWITLRNEWAEKEIPVRQTVKIFESVYELHSKLQKESESIEIIVGDGILNWRRKDGGIHYPLLLQRLQLVFKPEIPEFQFVEADSDPELYTALFQSMDDVDGSFLTEFHNRIAEERFHPLEGNKTTSYLTKLVNRLSPRGKFLGDETIFGEEDEPRIGRSPFIFVRRRTTGFANAIQSILEHATRIDPDLESALMNVLGISAQNYSLPRPEDMPSSADDVLLGKPANPEQIQIARTIDKYSGVLVQGPPGTGKTHTIANLLGHFLAQGKTVLVTSHTTKALRVLRDKMVDELKPLCVSVLDNDAEGRTQLQRSVQGIVEKISTINPEVVARKISDLEQHRNKLALELERTRYELLQARKDEYIEILAGDKYFTPSDAARFVAKGVGIHDWIPGPVHAVPKASLSTDEINELYQTNMKIKISDEVELLESLPDLSELLTAIDFSELANKYSKAIAIERSVFPTHWVAKQLNLTSDTISDYLSKLEISLEPLLSDEKWKLAVLDAGMHNRDLTWKKLIEQVQRVADYAAEADLDLVRFQPEVGDIDNVDQTLKNLDEIITYLQKNNSFGMTTFWLNRGWKKLIEQSKAGGSRPSRLEHFQAMRKQVVLQTMRDELMRMWDKLMTENGAPDIRILSDRPEDFARQFCGGMSHCLTWHNQVWQPFTEELKEINIEWSAIVSDQPPNSSLYGAVHRLAGAASGPLQELLHNLKNEAEIKEIRQQQEKILEYIRSCEVVGKQTNIIRRLIIAVERFDGEAYREILERLYELNNLKTVQERRSLLLDVLSKTAPVWAEAIKAREKIHGGELPSDPEKGWIWIQLKQELDRRGSISISELQEETEKLNDELRNTTNKLINLKAWYYQKNRTGLTQQQALVGYAETVKKMGAGTGKRVPQLRVQAMKLVRDCRSAVPVWIMPLARVVETFDPAVTKFDVVIVDEASQCDVMGLIALYLAKKVVIVGDHEQVSPLAIGQNLDVVSNLIRQNLMGIPNADLYDGQTSIYDLARTSFGGLICLAEHFRCVPEIIQFSNTLSYEGKIKPLRDASSSDLRPATIAHFVPNAYSSKKVNQIEAEEIARIIIGASKLPEYNKKTFGVITMLGEEQAMEIERRLRQGMSENEFNDRNIVCGTAAHFQGDERDVMFLSIVEGPAEKPPHRIMNFGHMDRYKKRFNVAASRARDQLWVIHSLDHKMDLQPNDLRRRLIEFAENPTLFVEDAQKEVEKTDSEFERDVMVRLRQRGYRVTPQWKVGNFRIDLVVEGSKNRLAIECDGDKYHPIEKLAEDMMRQAILERLGWKFARIRGSRYFQDPEEAISIVVQRLNQLDIEPLGSATISDTSVEDKLLYYKVIESAELNRGKEDFYEQFNSVVTETDIEDSIKEVGIQYGDSIAIEVAVGEVQFREEELSAVLSVAHSLNGDIPSQPAIKTGLNPKVPKLRITPAIYKNQENIAPEQQAKKEEHWIYGSSKDTWFALSHWAKEKEMFDGRERSLAYGIGMGISKKWKLSDKQLYAADRIYKKAIENGFVDNYKID